MDNVDLIVLEYLLMFWDSELRKGLHVSVSCKSFTARIRAKESFKTLERQSFVFQPDYIRVIQQVIFRTKDPLKKKSVIDHMTP